jgi:hypothetical protein
VHPTARFAELAQRDGTPLDCLLLTIAGHEHPVDESYWLGRLDDLAAGVTEPTLGALRRHLFSDLGFRGDTVDYGDPANSYLDRVIERRRGQPILLSVLTMEVGRRVGVELDGIGMPGHFLLRHAAMPSIFIDPFHGGVELDADDCRRLCERLQPGLPWHDEFLAPTPAIRIVQRVLANLARSFRDRQRLRDVVWATRLATLLPGGGLNARVSLIGALASAGQWEEAATLACEVGDALDESDARRLEHAAMRYRANLN